MLFLVGARYACLACATRGITRRCSRCDSDAHVTDLADESGRRKWLLHRAPGARAARPRHLFDPRALEVLPPGQRFLWLATRLAFVAGFALTLGSKSMPHAEHLVALLAHVLLACVFGFLGVCVTYAAIAVVGFLVIGVSGVCAQMLTLASEAASLVARFGSSPRAARVRDQLLAIAQRRVLQTTIEMLERLFVARMRVGSAAMPADGLAPTAGTIVGHDAVITAVHESSGTFELRDASPATFDIESPSGERITIVLGVGAVIDASERTGEQVTGEGLAPVPWRDLEGSRATRAVVTRWIAGTRVRVRGGAWSDAVSSDALSADYRRPASKRVRSGCEETPLWLEVDADHGLETQVTARR